MFRKVFIFCLLIIPALNAFIAERVTLNVNVPQEVEAGQEFRVQVTVNKSQLTGFARFQQTLPAGLKAVEVNSANAVDFTFEDNRLRIIWLRLPESESFTFSYRVRVDERLKGMFSLTGTFSYIDDNQRKSVDVTPELLAINPSPNVNPDLIVDINDFEKLVIPDLTPKEQPGIVCIRETPVPDSEGQILVNLLVNKNDFKQFAKIEEKIPEGYTALSVETADGIFTFKDQVAKFIWRNLPVSSYFMVSYKLIPTADDVAVKQSPDIDGEFSYFESDRTHVMDIVERDVDLLAMDETAILNLIRDETGVTLLAGNNQAAGIVKRPEIIDEDMVPVQEDAEVDAETDTVDETPQAGFEETPTETPVTRGVDEPYQIPTFDGVYYRIQVAAGHKPVDIDEYFGKFNLEKEVKRELHEGWNKYSVGSFDIYKDARDYRVHIWNTTEIDDAFVSAYNHGKRITVQEALMIANQKWYR